MASKKKKAVSPARVIRDAPFANRLNEACDASSADVPPLNQGRLTWVQRGLKDKFKEEVTLETVRKWFAGEARPKPDKMRKLAQLLTVDEAWLSLGIAAEVQPREQRARNAMADGAVNVLAGFVQMDGGIPSFPDTPRRGPGPACTDLYAIIRGAQYAFRVALANPLGNKGYKFTVPTDFRGCFVVGVVPQSGFSVDFLEMTPELIEKHGTNKGGFIEVSMKHDRDYTTGRDQWRKIKSFAERL